MKKNRSKPTKNPFWKLIIFILLITLSHFSIEAAVVNTGYVFTSDATIGYPQSIKTAKPATANSPITIGFPFSFNGTNYEYLRISTNGFIWFGGATSQTSGSPISGSINNVISPFGANLTAKTTGVSKIFTSLQTSGTTRVFVIEWQNFQRTGSSYANDNLTFQIRLYENTKAIEFIYNLLPSGSSKIEVGLKGNTADINFRLISSVSNYTWNNQTDPGSATGSFSKSDLSSTFKPSSGLIYSWIPNGALAAGYQSAPGKGGKNGSGVIVDTAANIVMQALINNLAYQVNATISSSIPIISGSLDVTVNNQTLTTLPMTGSLGNTNWLATVPSLNYPDAEIAYHANFVNADNLIIGTDFVAYEIGYNKVKGGPDVSIDSASNLTNGLSLSAQVSTLPVKFSQITQDVNGIGKSVGYPDFINDNNFDLVEIANFSISDSIDISGFTVAVETDQFSRSFTYPDHTYLLSNNLKSYSILNVGEGSGGGLGMPDDDPSNNYFNMGGNNDQLSSETPCGYILKNKAGDILDAVATNGYVFSDQFGIKPSAWYGSVPSSAGRAGIIRKGTTDHNSSIDWELASDSFPQLIQYYFNQGYSARVFPVPDVTWYNSQLGTFHGININIPVPSLGSYPFTLTVNDSSTTSQDAVVVNVVVLEHPIANFSADDVTPYKNQTVTFTDNSSHAVNNSPTSWLWTISPSTFTFVNGTDQNSPNPQVKFSSTGSYTVVLRASNQAGDNSKTKTAYIQVSDFPYSCIVPNTLSTKSIGSDHATFSWNKSIAADSFQVEYSAIACNTIKYKTYVNNPGFNSVTVNELKPLTIYYWRVRSVCNGVNGVFSCKRYFITSCNGSRTEGSEVDGSAFASPLVAYPNPAFDQVKVTFDSDVEGAYILHTFDMTGRELMRSEGIALEGTNVVDLDLSLVASGLLLISIEKGDGVSYTKIIVTK